MAANNAEAEQLNELLLAAQREIQMRVQDISNLFLLNFYMAPTTFFILTYNQQKQTICVTSHSLNSLSGLRIIWK
jgi:hypothetical protein